MDNFNPIVLKNGNFEDIDDAPHRIKLTNDEKVFSLFTKKECNHLEEILPTVKYK